MSLLKTCSGKQKGYSATCQARGTVISGDNLLVVDGEFTDLSEGNRLRRRVIGFGAEASALDTSVHMYQRANRIASGAGFHDARRQLPDARRGAPWAGGRGGGGSAASVAGASVAAGGVKTSRSAAGFLADKTAEQF